LGKQVLAQFYLDVKRFFYMLQLAAKVFKGNAVIAQLQGNEARYGSIGCNTDCKYDEKKKLYAVVCFHGCTINPVFVFVSGRAPCMCPAVASQRRCPE